MVDQEDYNKEYDKSVDSSRKGSIKLLKPFKLESDIEIPENHLEFDLSKAKLKDENKPIPKIKEFKPRNKIEDEPIW